MDIDEIHSNRWLRRLRAGGTAALARLIESHRTTLLKVIENRLDHRIWKRIDSADILQETFVDASRRLPRYLEAPAVSPMVWLKTLLWDRVLVTHRQHFAIEKRDVRREKASIVGGDSPSDGSGIDLSSSSFTPGTTAIHLEWKRVLQEKMGRLDPIDREILQLRHFQELSNREVAAKLQLTTAAASKRYTRALRKLKELVERPE